MLTLCSLYLFCAIAFLQKEREGKMLLGILIVQLNFQILISFSFSVFLSHVFLSRFAFTFSLTFLCLWLTLCLCLWLTPCLWLTLCLFLPWLSYELWFCTRRQYQKRANQFYTVLVVTVENWRLGYRNKKWCVTKNRFAS